jgi:predicted enzyme related to lactoylglutathione lyase
MSKTELSKAPKYQTAVFFVSDIKKAKQFYSEILEQKIVADFGKNEGFEGGLSIWEKDYALNTIFKEKAKEVTVGANSAEIYFESSNLTDLFERLTKEAVKIIHPIVEHPWGQRAFRIYDPDNHIIEFGEPMSDVIVRFYNNGLSIKEIAEKSLMPVEFIIMVLQTK